MQTMESAQRELSCNRTTKRNSYKFTTTATTTLSITATATTVITTAASAAISS
jgi:hypothetical protein